MLAKAIKAKGWTGGKLGAVALAVSLLAGGCTSIRDHRGFLVDQALIDSVQVGVDNKQSVERTLGRPTLASQFGDQVWYYIATDTKQMAFRTPRVDKQTILRVRFDPKGNVLSVDRAGAERVAQIVPSKEITPTLGKKRTLLEDLFGNIGTVGAGGGGAGAGGPSGGGRGPNGS
ncbi:outer membrane protein assembly factor BamE [Novosphingobium sp. FSY-8]|uniref:Outer membrane protein assembly factor BamE n=1 Tax=Novosphingobium ovatum TaxID=1908523 RepID=A0ABW9XFK1_9SPHN|nr:outer membrane protein assembly factor BamE [Novosphingobium ovatum]NBC37312.1 outer membrane protein assembly factor BamE [Novosphingobium ovatum]